MGFIRQIKNELSTHINKEKAAYLPGFFNAVPGGYGEGDHIMGITVPDQRAVAKKYYQKASLDEISALLKDDYHECRLTALFMMVNLYEGTKDEALKEAVIDCYLNHLDHVNNWDLVDSSAYKLLGPHLQDRDRGILYQLSSSTDLWRQRIAIITTLHFIRQHDFNDTLSLAEILLNHPHDLIHKAVGWMLREVGNRNMEMELVFLNKHYREMPRTMLRYAIEKFDPDLREQYLKGNV